MRRRIWTTAAPILLLGILAAWRPLLDPLKLRPESTLRFDGKSTVRDWSCKATRIDAVIDAEAGAVANVLKGQKAVRTVSLTFPTAQLDCANGTMNGHMLKALNATTHANIVFTLSGYELAAGPAPVKGTLNGTLQLNGVTKPIVLQAEFAPAGGALRATGSYALKMTDWQVEPPRLMMGALKVDPTITVVFDLQLQP